MIKDGAKAWLVNAEWIANAVKKTKQNRQKIKKEETYLNILYGGEENNYNHHGISWKMTLSNSGLTMSSSH